MSTDASQNDPSPDSALEENAEELYEMAPCGYLTTTIEGRIVKINRTLTEWLGYRHGELTGGKSFVDLLTVGGKIFYETHLNLLLRVKTAVDEIALDIVCKDGRVLPALINAREKRDAAGQPLVHRFTIFNASERRMYERELLATRDLLRITLSSIADGVIATDAEGRINFMNPIAEGLSGWKDDAARGKPIGEVLVLVREETSETVENPITHALRDGTAVGLSNHTVLVSKDGRRIPIDDSASPIRDDRGNVVGAVLVFRDISERRKAEELERERQERHREAVRLESLGLMAGGIAHDFNNLLTAVLGNASLLAESVGDREAPLVSEILYAGERAAALTKQMLAYSGNDWLELVTLDLNAHIRDSLTLMRASLSAKIDVELELGPAEYVVKADAAQIRQVIVNLLINAAEAIGAGPGKIVIRTDLVEHRPARFSAHLRSVVPGGMYAMLEVRDNGTGMAADTLKKIFDPFFTTKFTGRGLGLSAVLGIVKGHGGDIEVVSEPGVGSAFRIFLPAPQRIYPRSASPAEAPSAALGNRPILVVDDEEIVRKFAAGALQSRGMHVFVAENGFEALAILAAQPSIAAVILDLTMPIMTGDEALPLIKAMRPELPVIISSGFSEAEMVRRFESSGISSVLSKPYTIAAMISKVTDALQSSNPGPGMESGRVVS